jgi:hypothetical protein
VIYLAASQILETLTAKGDVKFMGVTLGVSLHCLVSSYPRELPDSSPAKFLTGGRAFTLRHRDRETDREEQHRLSSRGQNGADLFSPPVGGRRVFAQSKPATFGMQFQLPHSQNRMRRLYFIPAARLYNPHVLMLF